MSKRKQPSCLVRGHQFHAQVQAEWIAEATEAAGPKGKAFKEKRIYKPSGRPGRIDIFVNDSDPNGSVAVVEIKASDWDRMTEKAVRRNAKRQIRQIWSYIESSLCNSVLNNGKNICPGVIFQKRPSDPDRLQQIEELFNDEGISVVWHDESINECRQRKK